MLTFRDLVTAFRQLRINSEQPVIAHASLSAFGQVKGGAETVVGALLASFPAVIMPTFTYKTMIVPEAGPANNGLDYGSGRDVNRLAEFFRPNMSADRLMGEVAECLRQHPDAFRSTHPILSFAGVGAEKALRAQSLADPLAPVAALHAAKGWVLLLGVDHTVNTSIHYAERLAGRKQFVRWALTPYGVKECSSFPGCSDGFRAMEPDLRTFTRSLYAGQARVQAIPLREMVTAVQERLREDPLALLCERPGCERCEAVREAVREHV